MGKITAQFNSGEVAWLLNGSTSAGNSLAWYQNLSAESGDIHPVLTKTNSNTVYQVKLYCGGGTVDAGMTYANSNKDVTIAHKLPETASFNTSSLVHTRKWATAALTNT